MAFSNDITGGQGALIRPAIKSPNYQAGVQGWTINRDGSAEFSDVVIRGTLDGVNYIINEKGAFFYNGTPALGNLIASIAAVAGVDDFGNAYSRVFNVGNQSGAHFGVDSFGTVYAVNALNQNVIQLNPSKQAIFVYSGTPAAGNLIASVAATSGTDTVGNPYLSGFTSYGLDAFSAPMTSNVADGALTFTNPNIPTMDPGEVSATQTFSPNVYRLQIFPPRPGGFGFPGIQMYTESALGALDDMMQIYASILEFPNTDAWSIGAISQGMGPIGFVARQTATAVGTAEAVALTSGTTVFAPNRAYEVTAHGLVQSTVAADIVRLRVRKTNVVGASLLDTGMALAVPNTSTILAHYSAVFMTNGTPPTAALVLTYARSGGTGNVSVFASGTDPAYLQIKDIGVAADFPNARLLT